MSGRRAVCHFAGSRERGQPWSLCIWNKAKPLHSSIPATMEHNTQDRQMVHIIFFLLFVYLSYLKWFFYSRFAVTLSCRVYVWVTKKKNPLATFLFPLVIPKSLLSFHRGAICVSSVWTLGGCANHFCERHSIRLLRWRGDSHAAKVSGRYQKMSWQSPLDKHTADRLLFILQKSVFSCLNIICMIGVWKYASHFAVAIDTLGFIEVQQQHFSCIEDF